MDQGSASLCSWSVNFLQAGVCYCFWTSAAPSVLHDFGLD